MDVIKTERVARPARLVAVAVCETHRRSLDTDVVDESAAAIATILYVVVGDDVAMSHGPYNDVDDDAAKRTSPSASTRDGDGDYARTAAQRRGRGVVGHGPSLRIAKESTTDV